MKTMTNKEQKFFNALRDVFVGAKVEGKSGYINLMRIKSKYYTEGVFPHLTKDIDEAVRPFSEKFREELFDRLYDFFHRYFSESGSIYFRYTPLHQNIYEKVYTDDRDVMLFWKTHMLYYVKTDRTFESATIEIDAQKFFFDVSRIEHKKANEKREIVYVLSEVRKDKVIVFAAGYSEKGKITKTDDILKALKKSGNAVTEDVLQRAFRVFEKQSEVDYFINKDAKAFLEEQFNLWLYQYVFAGETTWSETRIKQLQALKNIAFKIIAFISQFENELVKIWSKPKIVVNSNYVITLGKIWEKEQGLAEDLLGHKNIKEQIEEWKTLGIVTGNFKKSDVIREDFGGRDIPVPWSHLPIDTKYFKDLELRIIGLFDNLDQELDGWIVKSENYQALNTLSGKFREKVGVIYIDPPFNTDASEILYENNYKRSSWLSLVDDRMRLGKAFLNEDGIMCVMIDDSEFARLKLLVESSFGESNILGVVAIRNNPAGRSTAKGFSVAHEYAIFASNNEDIRIGRLERSPEQIARYDQKDDGGQFEWVNFRKHGGANAMRGARPRLYYPLFVTKKSFRIPMMDWDGAGRKWVLKEKPTKDEVIIYPISQDGVEKTWKWGNETVKANLNDLSVRIDQQGKLGIYMKSRLNVEGSLPLTFWDKSIYSSADYGTNLLKKLFGEGQLFSFPKSVYATMDCLRVANANQDGIILDFFGGSGTTAHAVINLNKEDDGNRKYLLVEMADYFSSVLLPRIKKVIFSDEWKDGKAKGVNGTAHFMKYFDLEQYEETLGKVAYEDANLFADPNTDPYCQYVFMRDLKMLSTLETQKKGNRTKVNLEKLYPNIDLAETLSNLTGKWIKRISGNEVEFVDGEKIDLKNLDWKLIKPLIWW